MGRVVLCLAFLAALASGCSGYQPNPAGRNPNYHDPADAVRLTHVDFAPVGELFLVERTYSNGAKFVTTETFVPERQVPDHAWDDHPVGYYWPLYGGTSHSGGSNHSGGTVYVRSYVRKDGTVVRAHTRSAPGSGSRGSRGSRGGRGR